MLKINKKIYFLVVLFNKRLWKVLKFRYKKIN